MAVPQQLVPLVWALIRGMYGHPGVAHTTILIQRKYHWTTLKRDVRAYVLQVPPEEASVRQTTLHDAGAFASAVGRWTVRT